MSDWNNKKEKRPRKDLVAELSRLTALKNDYYDDRKRLTARNEVLEAVLVAIVNFDHDQDCLPGCDSIMHEDLCPFCNPELVMIDMAKKAIAAEDKDDAG